MKLAEFRERYPQYKALTDEDLAGRLHAKFYSDMEFGEFARRIDFTLPNPQNASIEEAGNTGNAVPLLDEAQLAAGGFVEALAGVVPASHEFAGLVSEVARREQMRATPEEQVRRTGARDALRSTEQAREKRFREAAGLSSTKPVTVDVRTGEVSGGAAAADDYTGFAEAFVSGEDYSFTEEEKARRAEASAVLEEIKDAQTVRGDMGLAGILADNLRESAQGSRKAIREGIEASVERGVTDYERQHWSGQVAAGLGQIGAMAVARKVPKGLPVVLGGVAMNEAATTVDGESERLGVELSEGERAMAVTLGAAGSIVLERLPLGAIFGKSKKLAGRTLKERLAAVPLAGLAEGSTEATQGQYLDSLTRWFADEELFELEDVKRRLRELLVGGLVGSFARGSGEGLDAWKNKSSRRESDDGARGAADLEAAIRGNSEQALTGGLAASERSGVAVGEIFKAVRERAFGASLRASDVERLREAVRGSTKEELLAWGADSQLGLHWKSYSKKRIEEELAGVVEESQRRMTRDSSPEEIAAMQAEFRLREQEQAVEPEATQGNLETELTEELPGSEQAVSSAGEIFKEVRERAFGASLRASDVELLRDAVRGSTKEELLAWGEESQLGLHWKSYSKKRIEEELAGVVEESQRRMTRDSSPEEIAAMREEFRLREQEGRPKQRSPQNLGPGAANANEFKDRGFGARLAADERLHPDVRRGFVNDKYVPVSNEDTQAEVNAKLEEVGVVQAVEQALDPESDLSPRMRIAVGQQAMLKLDAEIRTLEKAGDAKSLQKAESLKILEEDLGTELSAYGTELGQGIQAFAMWRRMTPEGMLRQFRRLMKRAEPKEGDPLTPEQEKRVRELQAEVQDAPEGVLKMRATQRMLAELARVDGVPTSELLTAYWYANILSGMSTQAVNIGGSGFNLFSRTLGSALTTAPAESWQMLRGMLKGASNPALRDAAAALRGDQIVKQEGKVPKQGVLELVYNPDDKSLKGRVKNFVALGRWVFRAMQAADGFFWRSAMEGQSALALTRAARKRGMRGGALAAEVADQMYGTRTKQDAALAQAKADVRAIESKDLSRSERRNLERRRAYEILEAQRPEEVRAEGRRFGDIVTYTQRPDGLMGVIADAANKAVTSAVLPIKGQKVEILRPVVPFVNVVANVTSSMMDFTPVGLVRGAMGRHVVGRDTEKFTDLERRQRAGAAVLGSALTGILYGLASRFVDEDDPEFMVSAMGPNSSDKRRQLMASGWKPFSIKIGGKYFVYKETPLAIPMTVIGGFMDRKRYSDSFDEKEATEQLMYVVGLAPKAWMESGFLSSLAQTFDMIEGKRSVGDFGFRTAGGLIPAQGLLRDIGRLTNPEVVDRNSLEMQELLWKDLPFVQRFGTRPALNVFGEPVRLNTLERVPGLSRFTSSRTTDPELRWMAENNLFFPGIEENQRVVPSYVTKRERMMLEHLGRISEGAMTPEEFYEFSKQVGEKRKENVQTLMRLQKLRGYDAALLQGALERLDRYARDDAKRELLGLPKKRRDSIAELLRGLGE